jgi:carboxylesterase type B
LPRCSPIGSLPVPRATSPNCSQSRFSLSLSLSLSLHVQPSNQKNVPVYLYHYGYVAPNGNLVWGQQFSYCIDLVCHGSELPFVFDSADYMKLPYIPEEERLALSMVFFWSNFATNLNPNVGAPVSTNWTPFEISTMLDYLFPPNSTNPMESYLPTYCNFWDTIGYDQ